MRGAGAQKAKRMPTSGAYSGALGPQSVNSNFRSPSEYPAAVSGVRRPVPVRLGGAGTFEKGCLCLLRSPCRVPACTGARELDVPPGNYSVSVLGGGQGEREGAAFHAGMITL